MTSLRERLAASFRASFGDIVFGMEDGTVSIFGLVFGVAATTTDARVVLIAGLTGAIAAAVSMMAGAYLDAETARDQRRADAAARPADAALFAAGPMRERLQASGLSPAGLAALQDVARAHPDLPGALRDAFDGAHDGTADSPLAHALWMFASDLVAALVPVAPFALLPLAEARYVSIACTALVLIALGVGRARIAQRPVLSTTLRTLAIAAAAGMAGVLVGSVLA
ncbi:MAG: VIT1/CCC1 transporter family protein [Burkholderiales bacterium]